MPPPNPLLFSSSETLKPADINILPSFREARNLSHKLPTSRMQSKMVELWKNQAIFHSMNLQNGRFAEKSSNFQIFQLGNDFQVLF